MTKNNKIFFIVFILLIIPLIMAHTSCGGSTDSTDDGSSTDGSGDDGGSGDGDSGDSGDDNGSGSSSSSCAETEDDTGCDTLTVGTYTYYLSYSEKTQVKILKDDCSYCWDSIDDGDSKAMDSGSSTWSCAYQADGVTIDVTIAGVEFELSSNGQTLSGDGDSAWYKRTSTSFTCDGDTVTLIKPNSSEEVF